MPAHSVEKQREEQRLHNHSIDYGAIDWGNTKACDASDAPKQVLRHPLHQKSEHPQRTISGPNSAPKSRNPICKTANAAPTASGSPFTPNSMWRPYWG
jgi:hypothetical protein